MSAHEQTTLIKQVRAGSDRTFGLVMAIFFALVGVWSWSPAYWISSACFVLSGALLATGILAPHLLSPFNRVWISFGLALHRIVSPIVLGVVFFMVVTPIAIIMRTSGKDPLRLSRVKDEASYWIDRSEPPGPLNNQF